MQQQWKQWRGARSLVLAVVAAALAGCGGMEQPAEVVAEGSAPLLGGVATDARPEIGLFNGGCTATLITPRWGITAAHCTGYSNMPIPGSFFRVTRGLDGLPHDYFVDRIHIFGAFAAAGDPDAIAFQNTPNGTGTNDVAIFRLTEAVPPSVAVPAQLAGTRPANGTTVTVFGYGCQNRGTETGGGFKQAVTFTWPSSNVLCPGDSGGPVVIGQATGAGAIVAVNTGYWDILVSSWDVHGEATYFRDEIMNVIRLYDGTGLMEVGFDRPGSDLTSFVPSSGLASECLTACTNNSSCRAFTLAGGRCWLKSAVPDWTPCASCTSGIAPQKELNTNRQGSDFAAVGVGNQPAEACIPLCSGNPSCAAYTYVPPSGGNAAVCWLKSSVPGATIATGMTSGVRRTFEQNTNRAGGDWWDFDVANTPNACASRCQTEVNCRAFTFTFAGTNGRANAHCWLKSAVPGPSALSGAVSGVKRGLEQDTNRPGGDYAHFDLGYAVPQDCQARCAQDSRCKAFTYVPPGWNGPSQPNAHCWLKDSVPAPSSGVGAVSGVRGADFF